MDVPEVTCDEAAAMLDRGATWIDVREPYEWERARIADTVLVPMQQSPEWVLEHVPDPGSPLVVSCQSGARSAHVVAFLRQQGYTDVHNLRGGLQAWALQGRPVERGASR